MSNQLSLFDSGNFSQKTKFAAYLASLPKLSDRCCIVARFIASCGDWGATRDEVSMTKGIPPHSVPAITKKLIESGAIRETAMQRKTRTGCNAVVLVAVRPSD